MSLRLSFKNGQGQAHNITSAPASPVPSLPTTSSPSPILSSASISTNPTSIAPSDTHLLLPQPTFYPQEQRNTALSCQILNATLPSYLTPDQDPLGARGVPIFHPTIDEFEDFEAYTKSIEPWGVVYGTVKVVPPPEWVNALPKLGRTELGAIRIKKPTEQQMEGRAGLFRALQIERCRVFTFKQWVEHCGKDQYKAPTPAEVEAKRKRTDGPIPPVPVKRRKVGARGIGLTISAENQRTLDGGDITMEPSEINAIQGQSNEEGPVQEIVVKFKSGINPSSSTTTPDSADLPSPRRIMPRRAVRDHPVSYRSPLSSTQTQNSSGSTSQPQILTTPAKKSSPKKKFDGALKEAQSEDDEWYDSFDPLTSWLPSNTKPEDYTPELCHQLLRKYWREMGIGSSAWYGADLKGSLFSPETKNWNTVTLPSLLKRLNLKKPLPGVNTSYLYFGSWRATFPWHVEDCFLGSINYIHFGAPKIWMTIPNAKADAFNRHMRSAFPTDANKCPNFLAHKAFLCSPHNLANSSIQANIVVQHQQEFILTFPGGLHSGFNVGLNAASSCNFALDSWPEYGRKWHPCLCRDDTVRIDVDAIFAESTARNAEQLAKDGRRSQREAKKADKEEEQTKPAADAQKRVRIRKSRAKTAPNVTENVAVAPASRRVASKQKSNGVACIFCPSSDETDLLPIFNPTPEIIALAKKPVPTAHKICVIAMPTVLELNEWNEVVGWDKIKKSRRSLPCCSCGLKSGAKTQCSWPNCGESFHVTCAQSDPKFSINSFEGPPLTEGSGIDSKLHINAFCSRHIIANRITTKKGEKAGVHQKRLAELQKLVLPHEILVKFDDSTHCLDTHLHQYWEGNETAAVEGINGRVVIIGWDQIHNLNFDKVVNGRSKAEGEWRSVPGVVHAG